MVVTRFGADGVCVASHVTEEIKLALVHAPIPRQHTEDETAGDWDQLLKHKDVTRTSVPPAVSSLAQHKSHDTQPVNRFRLGLRAKNCEYENILLPKRAARVFVNYKSLQYLKSFRSSISKTELK